MVVLGKTTKKENIIMMKVAFDMQSMQCSHSGSDQYIVHQHVPMS